MKKSKHFRKDVIMARVIAGVLVIVLIALIIFATSLLTKPSGNDKDTQNTQSTQDVSKDSEDENIEPEVDIETEAESEVESESEEADSEAISDGKVYVKTTTQVKLREQPNTECATLDRIDGGTTLEVLETLDGWYKVIHNGKEGYVSADYAELVEE